MSSIDPSEATLAVIGMDAVISDAVEKVSAKQRRRIRKLDEEIKHRVGEMIHGRLKCDFPLPPPYRETLSKLFDSPIKPDQVQKMIAPLPQDVQNGFVAISSGVYKDIRDEFPRNTFKSIGGDITLDADDVEYFRWFWLYSVLNDPLRVINLMSTGALLRFQVDSVRENYPSISQCIDEAIDEAIPDARVKDSMFVPPLEADTGIKVWRSLPIIQGEYQMVYAKDNEEQKQDINPPKGQLSNSAAASESGAQAALYPRA